VSTILCFDDDAAILGALERVLRRLGHEVLTARAAGEALPHLMAGGVDVILSDYQMPGLTGLDFLELLKSMGIEVPVIMITGFSSIEHAVVSIQAGAVDYLPKPIRPEQLEIAVNRALELVRVRAENRALRQEADAARQEAAELRRGREILGSSAPVQRVLRTVAAAARTRATVLLQGESGTGKELFARALHEQSDRREKPYITLNCAALPEGLVESALFGHERGAFTGAVKRVEGAFERAHGGTLLLDEVSEMRLDLQAKLLRVLQEQEFERVGGTAPIRVDVRVIATTNRNLAADAAAGTFRQDLYYRLSVIPVLIPTLRERSADIPLLATHFALRTAREIGKDVRGLSPEALELVQRHAWPGNVRELEHAVERAVILSTGTMLQPGDFEAQRFGLAATSLPAQPFVRAGATPGARAAEGAADGAHVVKLPSLRLDDVEHVVIRRALEVADGNRTRAAQLLGVTARTLWNKLRRDAPTN